MSCANLMKTKSRKANL